VREETVERGLLYLAIGIGIVFSLAPFMWFALIALKPQMEITAIPPSIFPHHPTFEAIRMSVERFGLLHYIKNSVIVAGGTTLIGLCVAAPAAYALARLEIKFRRVILLSLLAVAMFPQLSIAGPVWKILRAMGWLNTYQGLIIPYLALTLPMTVWILANYFQELPPELEEAAMVDGATVIQTLTRIMMPLAAPGMFTAAILTFIYAWNEFFFALLIMTEREYQTVPVGIALFPGQYTMPWGELAAASTIATIPMIIVVIVFQKRIITGLTAGAITG
jgi:multiple sugar transport system permease protein